ncbi:PREDICTED: little elongation complex subunit 1 [Poecilia mexicana]|uniref:Little elongation complex subunit 1 C-terminal domain-containing protein n=1 Tax=Poecilia mexicana TaxID=48701 RepID=A0A3B3WZL6_9TELE|nr:PREDICTED: little elongation complex subunit 1 [Poecilia mexicana]
MMPGESQSNTAAIAADATVGSCQNCSVLHQSLTEYVASFLALKQKIAATDDSIRLRKQLEELQMRLFTLEKKTADYESVQAELEEKTGALKAYEQLSEEMDKLKQEKSNTLAENETLRDELKCLKDLTETQRLENARVKREKAAVENDLLKTQASLKESQEQAKKVDKLTKENAIMTNMKDRMENKVRVLEDSICKQNYQISQLTNEKILLERNISDLQVRLIKLERERCKDYRSSTTQTRAAPKVDKGKLRLLLQSVWECVDPEHEQSSNISMSPEFGHRRTLPPSPQTKLQANERRMSASASETIRESTVLHVETKSALTKLRPCARVQDTCRHQASNHHSNQDNTLKKSNESPKKNKHNESSPIKGNLCVSIDEIMDFFKPLPPCISPLSESDTSVEDAEMDGEEKTDSPELSEDVQLPKQDQPSSSKASPLHLNSPKSLSLYKKDNVDIQEHISDKKGNGHCGLGGGAELNESADKPHKNNSYLKNMSPPELLRSLLLHSNVSEEALPLPDEDMEHSHNENPNNQSADICDTGTAFERAKEDKSDTATKMDVAVSPGDIPDVTTVASYGERDATANSGEAENEQCVAQFKSKESLEDTSVTDDQKGHVDSCQDSANLTASGALCKDSEMPEESPPSSSDSMSCGMNKILEEGMEVDAGVHCSGENEGNAVQVPRDVDVTASPSDLNACDKPLSPKESPVLNREVEGSCPDPEHEEANSTALSPKDFDKEEAKRPSSPDTDSSLSPEKITVDCKSLEDKRHSVCRQLSPSCRFSQVKLLPVETDPITEKAKAKEEVAKNNLLTSEKEIVNQLHSDPTTSCHEISSATKEQNQILETFTPVHEQPDLDANAEENVTPVGSPTATQTPESISHLLLEMGPPLPPVLTPVTTPPKAVKPINPSHAIGKLSFPSPMDSSASTTPVKFLSTPNSQQLSCSSSLTSPTHPNGVPSSPLQFSSATPKHALPVPGRLPAKAVNSSPSSSTSPLQENSMSILNTMDLGSSACTWTLNILKGNVNLSMCSSENGVLPKTTDNQRSGFKTISSASTAFTKTETRGEKRPAGDSSQSKNSKFPKLDSSSADVTDKQETSFSLHGGSEATSSSTVAKDQKKSNTASPCIEFEEPAEQDLIVDYLNKIKKQCFDLLPVVQSHLYVGNLPKKPILRDEEKEVISDVCRCSLLQVDEMIVAILTKLKTEKNALCLNYLQALCRVYIGICRQKKYWEKARILAYSILVEDFPDSAKLVLFMVTTWPNVLTHSSLLCQAIHAVTQLKAPEGLLGCLSAFLGWEKNPPCDLDQLILRTLTELRSGNNQSFTKHVHHGEDLGAGAWEQIFTLYLLCSHKKWKWTYEHILGKELWPLMNAWVLQPRDQQEPVRDETVATVLRLIGRLGQLGLKEGSVSSLVTVANIINTFGRHGQAEGVPWTVQLAAIYCIYELSPCNPKQALDALAEWRGEAPQNVPPAVTSCINQIAYICRNVRS